MVATKHSHGTISRPDICENRVNKLEETIVKNLASEDMDCSIFTALK